MDMGQEEQNRLKGAPWWVSLLAALMAFSAALCYFLGRTYLDAYYMCFGISHGVLSFTTYDYLFSSINILFIVIGVIPGILMTYGSVVLSRPFFIDTSKPRKQWWGDILWVVFVTGFCCWLIYEFFTEPVTSKIRAPMLTSFFLGFGIGFVLLHFVWLGMLLMAEKWQPNAVRLRMGYYLIAISIVYFFAVTPLFAERMAERMANTELTQLPKVTISYKQLPVALTPLVEGEHKQIHAQLLTINNDRAYFIIVIEAKQNGEESPITNRARVYSTEISDIECIIYGTQPE